MLAGVPGVSFACFRAQHSLPSDESGYHHIRQAFLLMQIFLGYASQNRSVPESSSLSHRTGLLLAQFATVFLVSTNVARYSWS